MHNKMNNNNEENKKQNNNFIASPMNPDLNMNLIHVRAWKYLD